MMLHSFVCVRVFFICVKSPFLTLKGWSFCISLLGHLSPVIWVAGKLVVVRQVRQNCPAQR
jgi:hypothetical protein